MLTARTCDASSTQQGERRARRRAPAAGLVTLAERRLVRHAARARGGDRPFNAALAAEARAKGAEWVDLVPLMQQQAAKGQLASDGLHPSSEAYDEWAAELARVLTSPCATC